LSKLIAFISTFALLFLMIGVIIYVRVLGPAELLRRTLDPPAIVKEVQQLNELVTVRYTIQKVVGMTQQKVPVGSESILLMVQAKVSAGVNLAGITQYDVNKPEPNSAQLRLPAAKLFDVSLDEKSTKVWDRRITRWTPWVPFDKDLEHRARLQALDDVRTTAIEMGILRDADRNAQTAIRDLLRPLGIQSVTFGTT
jgi:hypothetical protein